MVELECDFWYWYEVANFILREGYASETNSWSKKDLIVIYLVIITKDAVGV